MITILICTLSVLVYAIISGIVNASFNWDKADISEVGSIVLSWIWPLFLSIYLFYTVGYYFIKLPKNIFTLGKKLFYWLDEKFDLRS